MQSQVTSNLPRVHIRALARLQHIHEAISAGQCPSLRDLTESIGRTARTLKRDLRSLREDFHAPLIYDYQRKGFRYTEPGWQLPPARLSEGELLAFFTAHHVLQAIGHKPEALLLRNALAKLAAFLPEHIAFDPRALSTALTFQPLPYMTVEPYVLRTLTQAAMAQRTMFMHYHSQERNELTERKIDALHLHNFAGDWYVIAFDHRRQEVREFHVGRIRLLETTEDFFIPPPAWNAADYLRQGFFMMRGGRLTTVSLLFDAYQARWIRERHTFHEDEQREELPNGELRLLFPVGSNGLEAVARFCLTYAGHCRVEKPAALRKLVYDRLQQALQHHQEG